MWSNTDVAPKSKTGQAAEDIAERFLRSRGLSSRARNFRCPQGEIDLIMADQQTLVFVEVRYRRHSHYGSPAETVSRQKQRKVIKAAQHYLLQQRYGQQPDCRFDVVALTSLSNTDDILWLQNAFAAF